MNTSRSVMPERTARRRLEANEGRGFKVMMVIGAVLLALVFPVEAIVGVAILMIAAICLAIVAGVYWGLTWLSQSMAAADARQRRARSSVLRARPDHPVTVSMRRTGQDRQRSTTRRAA